MNSTHSTERDGPQSARECSPESAALVDCVYDELHALASAYLRNERPGHTLQTTALVNEAWLRLSKRDTGRWNDRAHFLNAAALAMRRILINHAEKRHALKRGGVHRTFPLEQSHAQDQSYAQDPARALDQPADLETNLLALNKALDRLGQLDAHKAKVVELKFFGGCTIDETAEALGTSTATVERDWRFARAWLRAELENKGG